MNNIWLRTAAGAYIALMAQVVCVTTDSQGQPGKAAITVDHEEFIGGIESREVAQTALDTLFGQIHAKTQENERFIIIRAESIYTAPATDESASADDAANESADDQAWRVSGMQWTAGATENTAGASPLPPADESASAPASTAETAAPAPAAAAKKPDTAAGASASPAPAPSPVP